MNKIITKISKKVYLLLVLAVLVAATSLLVFGFADTQGVNVQENTVIYDDVTNSTDKVVYNEYSAEKPAEYGYDYIEVDTIPKGTTKVIAEGVPGVKKVNYLEKYVNGEFVSCEVVSEEIITRPVRGVAEKGVGGTVTAKDGTVYNYDYKELFEATAYTYVPGITTMTTSTGQRLREGLVAVDPKKIPYHTEMFITSDTWEYGYGIAEDCGGAIKGNRIDLAYMSYDTCIKFGRRDMWVYFLEK